MTLDEKMAEINREHGWPGTQLDPELRTIIDRDMAMAKAKRASKPAPSKRGRRAKPPRFLHWDRT
jgi:hypothetical protein